MKKKVVVALAFATPFGAIVTAQGCADFSSGQCTDKALCDALEASTFDSTFDAMQNDNFVVDVNVDTIVKPDGDVPDGDCNGGAEDCANGKDDNCDGLIDCADPVCQNAGYECVALPAGWSGPVALASVAGGNFPSCTGSYATPAQQGHDGTAGSAATCGCSCGGPTNVSCNTGIGVSYYTNGGCTTANGGANLPNVGFCVTTGDSSNTGVEGDTQPAGYNGDCTSTPSKTVPAITYSNSYTACSYDGPADTGGCTSAQCVQGPAGGKTCVYEAGDNACPATTYTVKTLFYTGDTDTRSCSTCTCTATAATCTGTINVYSGGSCTGSLLATVTTNEACSSAPGALSSVATAVNTNPGTCGNNGTGGPTGSVTATSPITVCCTP